MALSPTRIYSMRRQPIDLLSRGPRSRISRDISAGDQSAGDPQQPVGTRSATVWRMNVAVSALPGWR